MGNSNGKKKSSGGESRSPSPVANTKNEQLKPKHSQLKDRVDPILTDQSMLGKSGIHLPKSSSRKRPDRLKSAPLLQTQPQKLTAVETICLAVVRAGKEQEYWTDKTVVYNKMPDQDRKHLKIFIYLNTIKPIKILVKNPANTNADWIRERFFEKVKKLGVDFPSYSRLF